MLNLRNKTIVLTGASSGIGRATALMFARDGANLMLATRREVALQNVAATILPLVLVWRRMQHKEAHKIF